MDPDARRLPGGGWRRRAGRGRAGGGDRGGRDPRSHRRRRGATLAGHVCATAIAAANNRIFAEAQVHPELDGMACVLTLALVSVERMRPGDHRACRRFAAVPDLAARAIRKLTSDHSPVGEDEDAGELTEEEAMLHPRRNEVFRDVGSRAALGGRAGFHRGPPLRIAAATRPSCCAATGSPTT